MAVGATKAWTFKRTGRSFYDRLQKQRAALREHIGNDLASSQGLSGAVLAAQSNLVRGMAEIAARQQLALLRAKAGPAPTVDRTV